MIYTCYMSVHVPPTDVDSGDDDKKKSVLDGASDDESAPNTYDYNDSFIDDSKVSKDAKESQESTQDSSQDKDEDDEEEEDVDELKKEAKDFIKNKKAQGVSS